MSVFGRVKAVGAILGDSRGLYAMVSEGRPPYPVVKAGVKFEHCSIAESANMAQ